ncbi:hypothetical protein FQR65_LT06026 [Abscondita terminalis]|nr:hypothetical protein FQR65_LT06026 [Abscondita terminalis]
MSSRFSEISLGPPIEVFALTEAFNKDNFDKKVNLGVGAYRTEKGKPWVLPVVKDVEKLLASDDTLNKEYLPVLGNPAFCNAATSMLLGADNPILKENRAFGIQCLSGTGALRVAADFLVRQLGSTIYYYSTPTWENHTLVFNNAGFKEGRAYRYWDPVARGLDLEGMLEDLREAPENAVIILHACAHNPTGCDPTQDQWKQIADVIEEKKLFPLFDSAYQGFASGDLEKDAWAVRYFASRGFEMFCTQSFAKNFGLYCERVGNLTVIMNNPEYVVTSKSQFTLIIRGMYSNPPSHGALIVAKVLTDPNLFEQWKDHIRTMSSRIIEMRKALRTALEKLQTPGDWSHITSQIGMFSYTGLNENQSLHMVKTHHVYMLKSGRISMCGVTPTNVDYVAQSIHDTLNSVI